MYDQVIKNEEYDEDVGDYDKDDNDLNPYAEYNRCMENKEEGDCGTGKDCKWGSSSRTCFWLDPCEKHQEEECKKAESECVWNGSSCLHKSFW